MIIITIIIIKIVYVVSCSLLQSDCTAKANFYDIFMSSFYRKYKFSVKLVLSQ